METIRTENNNRAQATQAKIEEIRKNIFSIYAKEFDFKQKRATDISKKGKSDNSLDRPEPVLEEDSVKDTGEENSDSKSDNSVTGNDHRNSTKSPVRDTENPQELEAENDTSPRNEQSPIRVNTTSFSVTDILDPGKFTGVKLSPKRSWHPWLQREDRGLREESDEDCMIDDSGTYNNLL